MNTPSPYTGTPGYDPRPRQFTRPGITTVILIMLVFMIVRDVLARRRRLATQSSRA
jgi:hypothetical protein